MLKVCVCVSLPLPAGVCVSVEGLQGVQHSVHQSQLAAETHADPQRGQALQGGLATTTGTRTLTVTAPPPSPTLPKLLVAAALADFVCGCASPPSSSSLSYFPPPVLPLFILLFPVHFLFFLPFIILIPLFFPLLSSSPLYFCIFTSFLTTFSFSSSSLCTHPAPPLHLPPSHPSPPCPPLLHSPPPLPSFPSCSVWWEAATPPSPPRGG